MSFVATPFSNYENNMTQNKTQMCSHQKHMPLLEYKSEVNEFLFLFFICVKVETEKSFVGSILLQC